MAMPSNHGATNMDQTLKDYITRTMAKLESEKQVPKTVDPQVNPNNYEVWPEQPEGDNSDHKRNPYSPV
jgi:hypothetical protein